MSDWQTIETAPKDFGPILLACWRDGELVWACAACWERELLSYAHRASQSGWYPLVPMVQRDRRFELCDGLIGGDFPPTHWRLLAGPPEDGDHPDEAAA